MNPHNNTQILNILIIQLDYDYTDLHSDYFEN